MVENPNISLSVLDRKDRSSRMTNMQQIIFSYLILNAVSSTRSELDCGSKLHSGLLRRNCIIDGVWTLYDDAALKCNDARLYLSVETEDSVSLAIDSCGRCFEKTVAGDNLSLFLTQRCIQGRTDLRNFMRSVKNKNRLKTKEDYLIKKIKSRRNIRMTPSTNDSGTQDTNYMKRKTNSSDNESVADASRSYEDSVVNTSHDTGEDVMHPNESIQENSRLRTTTSKDTSKLAKASSNQLAIISSILTVLGYLYYL